MGVLFVAEGSDVIFAVIILCRGGDFEYGPLRALFAAVWFTPP